MDAERGEDRALGQERHGNGRVGSAFDHDLLSQPAAVFSPAAAVGAQPLVMEPQRGNMFADLDRGGRHVGRPGQAGLPVAAQCRAHAAVEEEHVGVGFARFSRHGVAHARLVHAPHRRTARRHHAIRHDLPQAAEHQHRQIMPDQHARSARCRELRMHDAALRRTDADRAERAFVVRQGRAGADFHAVHRHRIGIAHGAVDRPVHLRIGAGIVDVDRIAIDRQRHADGDRLVEHAVGLQFAAIGAVGQRADRRAHRGFAAAVNFRCQSAQIGQRIGIHQRGDPFLHQVERDDLRPQIAERLVGRAHVLAQQGDQGLVGVAGAHQFHGRNLEAFLEHLARFGAADFSPDIRRMRRRCAERHQVAVAKDRLGDGNVGQVAGAEPDVVGDQHVARRELLRREVAEKMLHRCGQRADETGNALGRLHQRLARIVGDDAGEVVALAHQGREGGAHQGRGGFVHQRDQPAPEQFEGDRVEVLCHGSSIRRCEERSRPWVIARRAATKQSPA